MERGETGEEICIICNLTNYLLKQHFCGVFFPAGDLTSNIHRIVK